MIPLLCNCCVDEMIGFAPTREGEDRCALSLIWYEQSSVYICSQLVSSTKDNQLEIA